MAAVSREWSTGPLAGVGIKPGVILRGLDGRMEPVIREARDIWLKHGEKLVITSGLDGKHVSGSRHYAGLALDFRSRHLTPTIRLRMARELSEALGKEFQVFLEKDHIHVEYDAPTRLRHAADMAEGDPAHHFR